MKDVVGASAPGHQRRIRDGAQGQSTRHVWQYSTCAPGLHTGSAASATTVGWIECKALRTAAQGAAPAKPEAATKTGARKSAAVKLQGNWENADGTVKLEAQAGNKCFISFGPMTGACTYKQSDDGVKVMFDGEELVLVANDDGSLSSAGDPTAMIPIRLKRK
jgi:hypothetical protein